MTSLVGGIFSKASCPMGHLLIMDKKDDKLKMCIDYHALIKNNYILPHINDLLDRFNGAK
jgi:hypothetical protein